MASPTDLTNSTHRSGRYVSIQRQADDMSFHYPSPTTKCNPSFLLLDDQQQTPSLTCTLERVRTMKSVYIAKKANKKRCYASITATKEVESADSSQTQRIHRRPASEVAEGYSHSQLGFGQQEEPTKATFCFCRVNKLVI